MKSVKANVFATPIRVRVNTSNKNKHQWGQIIDAKSGAVLHTGQLKHIKYVAKKKYNTVASFQARGVVGRTPPSGGFSFFIYGSKIMEWIEIWMQICGAIFALRLFSFCFLEWD